MLVTIDPAVGSNIVNMPSISTKPGVWVSSTTYWPTITPASLMPSATESIEPNGESILGVPPLFRLNALPLATPTTSSALLSAFAIAAGSPKSSEMNFPSALRMKFASLPSAAVVKPTMSPLLLIPSIVVGAPAGPSKVVKASIELPPAPLPVEELVLADELLLDADGPPPEPVAIPPLDA